MLPSFGFSPQIAGEVSCWHFCFVNGNSARFLTQQNCGLLWATSVARFHLSALWQLNKSQRGWLGQQICNCKSVFLAPGSDLWVGVGGATNIGGGTTIGCTRCGKTSWKAGENESKSNFFGNNLSTLFGNNWWHG